MRLSVEASERPQRPGIAGGIYPERPDVSGPWLEHALASTIEHVASRAESWQRRLDKAVANVHAQTDEIEPLTAQAWDDALLDLRLRLRREGLTDALVARSFAFVREAAGRTLGMRHFDVQLIGGWVMAHGMIAEMQTGEGKTLTATLPACTAALAGIPVHVVTVNDYLVSRDAEWMRPIYTMLGLTVSAITEGMEWQPRRDAYRADVTYCTNKQLAFDYLRDRIVLGNRPGRLRLQLERLYDDAPRADRLLLRGLCFAIVDEADSVLVDEARTPLIISRGGTDDAHARVYSEALEVASRLQTPRDFVVFDRDRRIELTERGKTRLTVLARPLGGLWETYRSREELARQALSALHLFRRDTHYLVRDDKVQIIDEFTGRVMPDRAWEHGLHQMIEAKEVCTMTGQRETLARISYQRFFRRYLRLAGMSGTVREVAPELWSVYRLNVVTVAPNRPSRRKPEPDRVYPDAESKWHAVVQRVAELHADGRPVLIGTRSVAASEHLSGLLTAAGLSHQVLNARQDGEEAAIVARAGEHGRITVATNMAGRGTDIHLGPGVSDIGGLHVIATERHEARRIDRQLFGRCGRQGDPGSFEAILSMEDELVAVYCPPSLRKLAARRDGQRNVMPGRRARGLLTLAQRRAERHNAMVRRDLLKMDKRLGDILAFSGRGE